VSHDPKLCFAQFFGLSRTTRAPWRALPSALQRRAAAQRAEQQRIADYYARTTKEQEDRENAEARERFVESQRKRERGSE
jgi:hypothetical protein